MKKKTPVYKDAIVVLLAKNVKYYRDELGIAQEKAAELCGLHRNTIGRIERCELDVSLTQLAKVAKGFGLTPSELLSP